MILETCKFVINFYLKREIKCIDRVCQSVTNMETDTGRYDTKNDSGSDDDEIIMEFPTELIPDEYEHENGTSGLVYVLHDNEDIANTLVNAYKAHGFKISKETKFSINQKDDALAKLKDLADRDFTAQTCLIIAIIGKNEIFRDLYHVSNEMWSPFIDNKTLKYKPKIFLFFEYKEDMSIVADSFRSLAREEPYDVPSEADVLIVYQKSTDIIYKKKKYGYLTEFCENLKQFGRRDDIISILTRTNHKNRPLIISTLRKKFYVSSSSFREHYFDFESNSAEMSEMLIKLQGRLRRLGVRRKLDRIFTAAIQKSTDNPQKKEQSKIVTDGPSKRKVSVGSNISTTSYKKEVKTNASSKAWRY